MADAPQYNRAFGFGLRAMKKFPELIPLVGVLGFACGGAAWFSVYSLATKPDVSVNRSKGIPPWEQVDPETRQKLVTFNTKYEKIPELEALKKEIGSYKF